MQSSLKYRNFWVCMLFASSLVSAAAAGQNNDTATTTTTLLHPSHACMDVLEHATPIEGAIHTLLDTTTTLEVCAGATPHTCTFSTAGGRRSSCTEVCASAGGLACVQAWDDLNDDGLCPAGPDTVECTRPMSSKVCQCQRPECTNDEACRTEGTSCVEGYCRRGSDCSSSNGCTISPSIVVADLSNRTRSPWPGRGGGRIPSAPDSAHMCTLLSREVLTEADPATEQYAVHRLTFAMPEGGTTSGNPPYHVKVRAPDARGQRMRVRAYSAELGHHDHSNKATRDTGYNTTFALTVKIYPGGPPRSRGTSAYLGQVTVGDQVHVPEIRSVGWSHPPAKIESVGMVAFGVGIAEMMEPIEMVLASSSTSRVRLLYASRIEAQIIYRERLRGLLKQYPGRFSVIHCLSRQQETGGQCSSDEQQVERIHYGRITNDVLLQYFGKEDWTSGNAARAHFLVIGTRMMEKTVYSYLRQRGWNNNLFSGAMWQPMVPATAASVSHA